ncbi:MAG: F0F1 ATP synthase subunit A [Clostridiales bacterium]|nr:F0F1 ATP synthase subunit A [Clostridiales bacterium]MCF8022551.1 F0F1 ATP synthase subunit A [Clostridiales bacterium]
MVEQVHESLNVWGFPHGPVDLGFGAINLEPVIMAWVVMILIAIFTVPPTRNMSLKRPGKWQLMVEELYNFLKGLVNENLDPRKGAGLMCLIFTLFLFLLFSNLWGLIPTMMSPTADLNAPIALAVMVFVLSILLGIKYKGVKYFKHFIEPFFFFLPLSILEELAKPITLAFRLYGNIYAGEVLIAVLLGMFHFTGTVLGGFIPSVIWYAFSIFVGFIQAFIFIMLTIAYISQAVEEVH